jgi:hypothetical protein
VDPRHQRRLIEAVDAGVEALRRDVLEADPTATAVQTSQHRDLPRAERAIAVVEDSHALVALRFLAMHDDYTHVAGSMREL